MTSYASVRTRRRSAELMIKVLRRTLRMVRRQARITVQERDRVRMQLSILELHREISWWKSYIAAGCPVTKRGWRTMNERDR